MKYIIYLMVDLSLIKCSLLSCSSVERLDLEEIIFPSEIIANFLKKYLDSEEIFVSISMLSSNYDQKYFQQDLLKKLVTNSKFSRFPYNILNKLDQSREGNKNVFNLILVDGSASLA